MKKCLIASLLCVGMLCGRAFGESVVVADVNAGLADLANQDLMDANANFQAAVTLVPTNGAANVLLAVTRLLLLPQTTGGSNFLSGLGFPVAGRNIYDWTSVPPTNNAFARPQFPANYSSSTAITAYNNTVLPAITASLANLANVTDPNFQLILTSAEFSGGKNTTAGNVTLDYGDVQMLRTLLTAVEFFGYTLNANNAVVNLNWIETSVENQTLSIQSFFKEFPSFGATQSTTALGQSESAETSAINLYFGASYFILNQRSPNDTNALFSLAPEDYGKEAKFRTQLSNVVSSMQGPTVFASSGNPASTINLAPYFSGNVSLNKLLPQFNGDVYVNNSLPDYTFGGILPETPAFQVEGAFRNEFNSRAGIYIGNDSDPNTPFAISDNNGYSSGAFGVFVGANGQLVLIGQDDGDGSDDGFDFGFYVPTTINAFGKWQYSNNYFSASGSLDGSGDFSGELDYTNGVSVFLQGTLEMPSGPFQNTDGYYSGTFSGAHSGALYFIFDANGDYFLEPVDSSANGNPFGNAGIGAFGQFFNSTQFSTPTISGTTVSGTLSPNTLTISGQYVDSDNTTGTFKASRAGNISSDTPPVITADLVLNTNVALGTNITFHLGVTGSAPLSYQWYFDGNPIPGAMGSSLVVSNNLWTTTGTYYIAATVQNLAGKTNSQVSTVTVLAETGRPKVAITNPTPNEVWSNIAFTVMGTASDPDEVTNVYYSLNGAPYTNAATADNFAHWSAAVFLLPGSNTFSAYSVNIAGNSSLIATVRMDYVVSAPLTIFMSGKGTISPDYSNALLKAGGTYSVTAKAAIGYKFVDWTGGFLVDPILTNKPTLTFTMQSGLYLQANFVDALNPYLKITNPIPTLVITNSSSFTVMGVATDDQEVASVNYSLNNSPYTDILIGNNIASWDAPLALTAGTNVFSAYAVATNGNVSATNTIRIFYVSSNQLTVTTSGKGTISPNYSNAWLKVGENYSVTAKGGTGFVFANWKGGIGAGPLTLLTNKPALTFNMQSNLVLQATFVDALNPVLKITHPASATLITNVSSFTVTGVATDDEEVASVNYSFNGSAFASVSPPVLMNNLVDWSQTLALSPGTNRFAAYAVATNGNVSATNSIVILQQPTMTLFPIATNDDLKHPQAQVAFDGNNYLVVFGDDDEPTNGAVGQFVTPAGTLDGPLLNLNPNGSDDPPYLAFDGAKYLAAWADFSDTAAGIPVNGALVSPGQVVSAPIPLSQSTNVDNFSAIVYGDGVFFFMWEDSSTSPDSIRGAILDTLGNNLSGDFLVSANGREDEAAGNQAAFDGTHFLAVWSSVTGDMSVNGQFIDTLGNLVGSPFVIYTNSTAAAVTVPSVVFDGTKYLVLFNTGLNTTTASSFHIQGRFVTTSGAVMDNQISVTSDAGPQVIPDAASDGAHYLISWNQGFNPFATTKSATINGRFFDSNGVPTSAEFPIFKTQGSLIPLSASVLYDSAHTNFVLVGGLGKMTSGATQNSGFKFTNGIIDGVLISP